MNKGQLIDKVKAEFGLTTSAATATTSKFIEILKSALLAEGEVTLPDIGKLKVKSRPARQGRNPKTGDVIQIVSKQVVKFSPASSFTEELGQTTSNQ